MSNELLKDPNFISALEIDFKIQFRKVRVIEELKEKSDEQILNEAIKSWVRLTGWEDIIRKRLSEGKRKEAINLIRQQIKYCGSKGSSISFFMYGKKAEIETLDGRIFHPTDSELIQRYLDMEENISLF